MSRFTYRRNPDEQSRVTMLELFYDLVFVFAITQVTHLLLEHLTWLGTLQSAIVLLVVWWAWQYTTWATNELDPEATPIRLLLIALMLASLLMAVAIPEAFGDRALLFVGAYVFIQVGRQTFMTFVVSRRDTLERTRASRILLWFLPAAALWIAGAFAEGDTRITLWLFALAIDYVAPLLLYRVPGLPRVEAAAWSVGSSHFAERFQLFTIIALGETVVLTGATTSALDLDPITVLSFATAFFSTAALWWLYFNYFAGITQRRLDEAENRTELARDLFTFGHIPIIAGIILCAVGDELVIAHPSDELETAALLAVTAGPVLYLLAYVPQRLRLAGTLPVKRLTAAAGCVVSGLLAAAVGAPALALLATLVALLVGVIVWEKLAPS